MTAWGEKTKHNSDSHKKKRRNFPFCCHAAIVCPHLRRDLVFEDRTQHLVCPSGRLDARPNFYQSVFLLTEQCVQRVFIKIIPTYLYASWPVWPTHLTGEGHSSAHLADPPPVITGAFPKAEGISPLAERVKLSS